MTQPSTTSSSPWSTDDPLWGGPSGPPLAFGPASSSLALILLACFSIPLAPAQPRRAPPPPDLSAWFTFDEPLFRQPGEHRPQRVPGIVGSALKFNGKDQYVEIPASTPGINMGEDDFTIELWIRTTDSQHTCNVVDKRDNNPLGYLFCVYRSHPALQMATGGGYVYAFAMLANIADNRWHHIAGVVKRLPPQPPEIYVDGVKQIQQEGRHNAPLVNLDVAAPLWLGRHHANKDVQRDKFDFEGEIDELTFYHRALTAAEIQSIYRAGSRGKCRPAR